MKKILCVVTMIFLVSSFVFAQQQQGQQQQQQDQQQQPERAGVSAGTGTPEEESMGTDTAQQKLATVSISKFEDAGFWRASISQDEGLTTPRRLEGFPMERKEIPAEEQIGIVDLENDISVLGVKTEFFRRGHASISIEPTRPINLAGIVKTLSVWVAGRNYNHTLVAIFKDFAGKRVELVVGKLNFPGWKELILPIPEYVNQRDRHYSVLTGMQFLGFRIDCDMMETYGSFYVYFDSMRIKTDLFPEEDRDSDDMLDAW